MAATPHPCLMTTKKKAAAKPESVTPNREQRRREKFGKAGKVHQHNPVGPWPESEANPALKNVTGDQAAHTGRPDQDVTHQTGPGTGGATENADGPPEHEGVHQGTRPKG
jgi:hypothetical protein